MLFDRATIYVEGGTGGNGVVSFRREAHVPRGGPDGGDGGRGGDVILVCDSSRRDLAALGRRRHFRARRGGHGQGKQRHGARGADLEIAVPPGTQVTLLDGTTRELLADGERVVVASGGGGGHGNKRFAGATRQAPRFAENGLEGESGEIELHLKLLADAGLIGQPNAGKSSLLKRLTRADPKVGDYPFTTLEPALGTIEADDRQVVLADIPGLIEGAAGGAGLGHEFLAHIERCRLLVHLVEIEPAEGDPESHYAAVRDELGEYGAKLAELPEVVLLSKRDLLPDEDVERLLGEWRQRLPEATVLAASSATGAGLDELRATILHELPADATPVESEPSEFEAEHLVYRPGEDEGFDVEPLGEHRFRVNGRGIEMLFARHDTGNPEALAYLEQRLKEIGVIAALRKSGFESGDDVVIGGVELELHTG
ncbi:MAG: GTPase [Solirubrobacterales bacterium]|nr:GTPase [Solirubrobacterales bacterium]